MTPECWNGSPTSRTRVSRSVVSMGMQAWYVLHSHSQLWATSKPILHDESVALTLPGIRLAYLGHTLTQPVLSDLGVVRSQQLHPETVSAPARPPDPYSPIACPGLPIFLLSKS